MCWMVDVLPHLHGGRRKGQELESKTAYRTLTKSDKLSSAGVAVDWSFTHCTMGCLYKIESLLK